jgi:glutamine synthetase adenylyltransferase
MQFSKASDFQKTLRSHTTNVRQIFNKILKTEAASRHMQRPFPAEFEGQEEKWKEFLARHGFKDNEKAFRTLREFVEGPGYGHISGRTRELAFHLLPRLFELCPRER